MNMFGPLLRLLLFFVMLIACSPSPAHAQPATADQPVAFDFSSVPKFIQSTLRSNIYDPAVMETAAFKQIEQQVAHLAASARTREDFITDFNKLWHEGPFSHVRMDQARQSAEQIAGFLDSMNVGGGGAQLTWQEDIAVLTVNTMMGRDTIEQIQAAYKEIQSRNTRALIIDLRNNEGGTFAVRPLVGHLLSTPLEAGCFLSQTWARQHRQPPSADQLRALPPWQGWSLRSFWDDVAEKGVLRIVFEPLNPGYKGKTYLLTSRKTASAAELAASAIQLSGRAQIIGEKTAGKMLSQKMFDLPQRLQLSLPIADYYAAKFGRIEGEGISPDIRIDSSKALEKALELARADSPSTK